MDDVGLNSLADMDSGPTEIPSDDIPRYTHEPLRGPDYICILHLYQTKDRIECSIQQINVSERGYQALSYVWGNPEKPFRAIVRD
jgi:hypothetical protein